uniref:Uncharacterized protein n=1 Tax=viral metagenome TaxID=1070528 RepID=A0A6M3Y2C7_9ZZZZ
MKCPIPLFVIYGEEGMPDSKRGDCLLAECAWFHPTSLSCEVSRIASNLSILNNYMAMLVVRMPPVGQSFM